MPPINEWIIAAIVAITPVVVAGLKWLAATYVGKLPAWLKPILAMALGALAAYMSGVVVANPMLAAVIGMAVIGLREIVVQLGRALGMGTPKL
jgi:hypothetical protein